MKRSKVSRTGRVLTAAVLAFIFAIVFAVPAFAEETYMPECYAPLSKDTKVIKYPKKDPPYKLAFVNGFAGNAWRIQTIQTIKAWGLREENKKFIKELKIVSTGTDVAAQIAAIDNFIAAGFDGITFIAVNPTAFGPVIKRAKEARTVLVPFDNTLDTDQVVQVNENMFEFGAYLAESAIKHLGPNPKGTVLEVRGVVGNNTDRDRHLGAQQWIKKNAPNLKVVEVVGNWDTGTVQKVVADAIATHGKFDAIFCQHGTAGAINAVLDAKHPIIPISGDPENGVCMLLAKHKIPGGTVAQSTSLGALAMSVTVILLQGHPLPQEVRLPTPTEDNANLKDGVNYFSNLPPTWFNGINFGPCGTSFTAEEILKQTGDNL